MMLRVHWSGSIDAGGFRQRYSASTAAAGAFAVAKPD